MILYNVTVNVDDSVHDEWLEWMKNKHIPEVLATNLFIENKIFKLISPPSEDGVTYSIQYFLRSMDDYEKYQSDFAPSLQEEHFKKYEDKFHAFRTILESV